MDNVTTINRIYVCHTLYHVYVSLLKEFVINDNTKADIVLSTVYQKNWDIVEGLKNSKIFNEVHILNERYYQDIEGLDKYKKNHNNIIINMISRMIFTKKFGKAEGRYIDIDFRKYKDIYVFCDSDPIGYYLNYNHIYYHAVEDGLDCLKRFDAAHYDNRGSFKLKAFLAKHNFIFIQNGYSKYCIDMEVNDKSIFDYEFDKYKEVPRQALLEKISNEQKEKALKIFLPDADEIKKVLSECEDCVLFLTEAFPKDDESVRINVCKEILEKYCKGKKVLIKPHPADDINYDKMFPECVTIRGRFPIEVLNFLSDIHFSKGISIISSALDAINFVDEKINIGPYIYDSYEPLEKHAFMKVSWDKEKNS